MLIQRIVAALALAVLVTLGGGCGRIGFEPRVDVDGNVIVVDGKTTGDGQAATYNDVAVASNWAKFDTATVNPGAKGFVGAAFDGRYVYLVPSYNGTLNGIVARFDTQAVFTDATAWSTFDTTTVDAKARGFNGVVFDGRYLYFVPMENLQGSSGTVARFDTQASFGAAASWSTFDVATVSADAVGFYGATFDGRYIYFSPYVMSRAVRYDTQQPFTVTAAWSTFNLTALMPDVPAYPGTIFDGRYVYFVPLYNSVGGSGQVTRYDTMGMFSAAASWTTFDTTTVAVGAKGFVTGAFDGRYIYLVPFVSMQGILSGLVTRYDTRATFASAAAWSTFDATTVNPNSKGFVGGAFDGRYTYFVPANNGIVTRYDTQDDFAAVLAWSAFDTVSLGSAARGYNGAVFDGRYLYFVPHSGSTVARFDAKMPPSLPMLPAHFGSFL